MRKREIIPFKLYFANYSKSWKNSGVAFVDTNTPGKTLGVAYLITREQLNHIHIEENGGNRITERSWYKDLVELDPIDRYKAYTFTNKSVFPYNAPCDDYLDSIRSGLKENYNNLSDAQINAYIKTCN